VRYLELLERWSRRVNLTGARAESERIELLVRRRSAGGRLLQPGSLLDVGSGNGSPGLVLALVDPDRPVTLLEPRTRRWAFLLEAARRSGRPDVSVLRQRHQDYRGARAANVTARALRLSADDLERLLAPRRPGPALPPAARRGARAGGRRVVVPQPGGRLFHVKRAGVRVLSSPAAERVSWAG
jgi:16S rRNA G527 N7-methylase RsmG